MSSSKSQISPRRAALPWAVVATFVLLSLSIGWLSLGDLAAAIILDLLHGLLVGDKSHAEPKNI